MPYRVLLLKPKSRVKSRGHGHAGMMVERNGKPSTFRTILAARKAARAWLTMYPGGTYAIMRLPLKPKAKPRMVNVVKKPKRRPRMSRPRKVW